MNTASVSTTPSGLRINLGRGRGVCVCFLCLAHVFCRLATLCSVFTLFILLKTTGNPGGNTGMIARGQIGDKGGMYSRRTDGYVLLNPLQVQPVERQIKRLFVFT